MNTMMMSGYQAVIAFDPDLQMFRGEFVGLNGGGLIFMRLTCRGSRPKAKRLCVFSWRPASVVGWSPASTFRASFRFVLIRPRTKPPPSLPPRKGKV